MLTHNELAQVGGPGQELGSLPAGVKGQSTLRLAAPRVATCAGLYFPENLFVNFTQMIQGYC